VSRSTWLRRALALLVTGVSLYLVLPSLLSVFSSFGSLEHLDWPWVVPAFASETTSFAAVWQLDRIALRTRSWFPVVCAQLSSNAVGRIVPGGGATSTAFAVQMLRRAGADTGQAAAAFSASTGLQDVTALSLPLVALPAMVGGAPIAHGLETAAYLGGGVSLLLLLVFGIAFRVDAAPLAAGRGIEWVLNHTLRRRRPVHGLPQKLLDDRNFIRRTLGEHWRAAVPTAVAVAGFDYLALLCSLRAVGADPRPSLVLLAYTAAQALALIPFTPGGLGFVEAGLVGTLTLAGVRGPDAVTATLLYRLLSYWLPLPAGGVAYLLFRRRYGGPGADRLPASAIDQRANP
jgi:uncharacterized protein (TIRG00374 family)